MSSEYFYTVNAKKKSENIVITSKMKKISTCVALYVIMTFQMNKIKNNIKYFEEKLIFDESLCILIFL